MRCDAASLRTVQTHRSIFALVADMTTATQIVKCAAGVHVGVKNFDHAEKLVMQATLERPFLVILDLERCESEAFRVLNELHKSADLKDVPAVGFVSQAKAMVKPEAEKAGCSRVYLKTEFGRELPDLIARYAV